MGETMGEQQQYDEISLPSLLDCLKTVSRHKILIILIVVIGVVGTGVASLRMMPIYEAKAVIIPAGVLSRDQGSTNFLATQFGIAPPTTPASVEIVNILKSNVLREKILSKYNLAPLFFSQEQMRNKTENQLVWQGLRYLQGATTVTFSQKDNLITVSFRYKEPDKAAQMVGYILSELNNHMASEAKRVADTNRYYLEAQLDRAADPFIKAKVYGLIAQQIETSVMTEVKENFAFKVLDPPRVPDTRISPKRSQMVEIAFLVSLCLGIFAAFTCDYVRKLRNK
jgi:uncharacterized protein involved in exopolysaccharide biosynthesis